MQTNRANGTCTLWKMFQGLEEFRRLDPEIPPQAINTFLYVATHEGCILKDIAETLGVAQSSMSRNVAMLDRINRHHERGLELIRAVEDPNERRRKIVTLTPRGRQLRDRLHEMFSDQGESDG